LVGLLFELSSGMGLYVATAPWRLADKEEIVDVRFNTYVWSRVSQSASSAFGPKDAWLPAARTDAIRGTVEAFGFLFGNFPQLRRYQKLLPSLFTAHFDPERTSRMLCGEVSQQDSATD